MNIEQVLEQVNITHDDKARRVLNTAPNQYADITLDEIKQGVTIERLETLSVPVYMYGTQITIHGLFKDMPDDLIVCGYKSVFLNQNKSLGVKYVAIDGNKKLLLEQVSRFRTTKWAVLFDSKGCYAQRIFRPDDKQSAIDCYNSTPDDLYIGNKQAVKIWYGGYAVILHIGAIYQDKLWQLITALTGLNETEYNTAKSEYEIKRNAETAQYEIARQLERERIERELSTAKANFSVPNNWTEFKGKIKDIGTYARIYNTYTDGIALQVIKVVKRGAYLCYNSKSFKDFKYVDWIPSKYHKCEHLIDGWQILDNVSKTTPKATQSVATPKSDTTPMNSDISITRNHTLNGIEIKFKNKPSETILDNLRNLGFRWHWQRFIWYAKYNDSLWQTVSQINV